MIWIFLYLLIFGGGAPTTFYLTPALKKNVKTYVKEKSRQKEIFHLMADAKKEQKRFFKKLKKYSKEAEKLNQNKHTTQEQFNDFLYRYFTDRKHIQDFSIDIEIRIKKCIKVPEWDQITTNILTKNPEEKIRKKMEKSIGEYFNHLSKTCKKNISNDLNRSNVLTSVGMLQNEIENFIPIMTNRSYKYLATIRKHQVSKNEYNRLSDSLSIIRQQVLTNFIDTRNTLLLNTSDEEWHKTIKAYNKLIKLGLIF